MSTKEKPGAEIEILDISELVEGSSVFEAKGYSIVKATVRGENGESVVRPIRIPIRSAGVADFQEKLAQKAPVPPVKTVDGAEIGRKPGELYRIFDTTDEKYIDDLEKHMTDSTFKIAAFAIDVPMKTASGELVDSLEEKETILRGLNLTAFQIENLAQDVRDLTRFAGERADFLSGRRSD